MGEFVKPRSYAEILENILKVSTEATKDLSEPLPVGKAMSKMIEAIESELFSPTISSVSAPLTMKGLEEALADATRDTLVFGKPDEVHIDAKTMEDYRALLELGSD